MPGSEGSASCSGRQRPGYNSRLFGGGLRAYVHNSRFRWVRETCRRRGTDLSRVVEIGCFDGRLLDWLPGDPDIYLGIDAGWEGGISAAQSHFQGDPKRRFVEAADASALAAEPDGGFTAAFALETLEHIPDDQLERYLSELARVLDGTLCITVPNEKGLIFLTKYLVKAAWYGGNYRYTPREVANATLGRMHAVARDEHKGFDYDDLVTRLARHFTVESVQAIPVHWLPPALGITIGIVCRTRAGAAGG